MSKVKSRDKIITDAFAILQQLNLREVQDIDFQKLHDENLKQFWRCFLILQDGYLLTIDLREAP